MTEDPRDRLIDQDWSSVWETLPDAPPLVPRPKTAQMTLRLPAEVVDRIRRVGAARSLPHHALVRSWLAEALRDEAVLPPGELSIESHTEQLNLKLEQELLDRLKKAAHELGRPYHRLARQWVSSALEHDERALGLITDPAEGLGIKELIVLLLHTTNQRGQDSIRGITRLQKLLFVIKQTVGAEAGGFYAYNYGPFDEGVNDGAKALELAGFLRGDTPQGHGPPTFAEMIAAASERAGPKQPVADYSLNEAGHALAERLRRSDQAYEELFRRVRALREEWDTPDLVERVYERWPEYAERSVIKDEVAARRAKRRQADS